MHLDGGISHLGGAEQKPKRKKRRRIEDDGDPG